MLSPPKNYDSGIPAYDTIYASSVLCVLILYISGDTHTFKSSFALLKSLLQPFSQDYNLAFHKCPCYVC